MGVAALTAYKNANDLAMDLWEQIYPHELLIALTDTFSTQAFFQVCLCLFLPSSVRISLNKPG